MIDKSVYEIEYIRELQKRYSADPGLIERALYTIRACVSIISRGTIDKEDYTEYLLGIKSLKNHILPRGYNTDDATCKACKVMYLASSLISDNPYKRINNAEEYATARLAGDEYKRLAYIRKQNLEAYACLVEATRNLG